MEKARTLPRDAVRTPARPTTANLTEKRFKVGGHDGPTTRLLQGTVVGENLVFGKVLAKAGGTEANVTQGQTLGESPKVQSLRSAKRREISGASEGGTCGCATTTTSQACCGDGGA